MGGCGGVSSFLQQGSDSLSLCLPLPLKTLSATLVSLVPNVNYCIASQFFFLDDDVVNKRVMVEILEGMGSNDHLLNNAVECVVLKQDLYLVLCN